MDFPKIECTITALMSNFKKSETNVDQQRKKEQWISIVDDIQKFNKRKGQVFERHVVPCSLGKENLLC